MRHVFYRPIYGTVPRAYNGTLSVFFFQEAESCEWELTETLWQNREIK